MRLLTLIISCFFCLTANAKSAQEYLPADADLDPTIPTPESILGWDIGEWRISHDQLLRYMETLAAASDRITLEVIGKTHEQRPLIHLVFTSPENQQRLDELRQNHLATAAGEVGRASVCFASVDQAIEGMGDCLSAGDCVLLKASRGMGLEALVAPIQRLGGEAAR